MAVCVVATYIVSLHKAMLQHTIVVVIGHFATCKSFIAIILVAIKKILHGDMVSQIK
jgi:hypothetical protein